jgi:hypothetical protein
MNKSDSFELSDNITKLDFVRFQKFSSCHYGKAPSLFAGAGGLDGGVQRQQVGLVGDRGDDIQDLLNLQAALGQLTDDPGGFGELVMQTIDRRDGLFDASTSPISSPSRKTWNSNRPKPNSSPPPSMR